MTFDVHKMKWKLAWTGFIVLLFAFLLVTFEYNDKTWFSIFLQVFGLLITIYPTVLIFAQSRIESDKANRKMLDHFQELFQHQIDAIAENTNKQIQELQRLTYKQIEHYSNETSKVMGELNNNSILLAEILLKQLEESIDDLVKRLETAELQLKDTKGFKFGRFKFEREAQLRRITNVISWLQDKLNYYVTKKEQVVYFLKETNE